MPAPTPTPTPTPLARLYHSGGKISLFLKTNDTPVPTPLPTPNNIGGGFTVTSWNNNNGWLTDVNDCYSQTPEGPVGCLVGFSTCSGCGPGGTEIIKLAANQNYERNFSVTVSGSGTPTYQWQIREEIFMAGWSGWRNAPESHEFRDTDKSTLRWRYQGCPDKCFDDRRLGIRCVVNNTFITKPIYLRYWTLPGGGGGGYMLMNSSKDTYRHLI